MPEVREHLEAFWPDRTHTDLAWPRGPVEERLPGFRVRRIAPASPDEPWIYVSIGASEAYDGDGMEFFLMSPGESRWHVETLAMVATFHADRRYRLSVGSTIDIGRPWIEGSSLDHLLVSLPYPYGPALEHCQGATRRVQLLWLVPITSAEARYAASDGVEALEQLLERGNLNVLAPTRPSLV